LAAGLGWGGQAGPGRQAAGGLLQQRTAGGQLQVPAWLAVATFYPPPPGLACRSLSKEFYTSAADRYHACNNVTQALRKVGAKRLVVGHTPQMRGVNCECDGKVRLVVAAGRAGQQLWPQRGRARRVGVFLPFIHATGARLVVLVAGHCHLMTHAGPRLPSCRCGAWMWACPAACWTLRWVSWRSGRRPRARRMSPAESSR